MKYDIPAALQALTPGAEWVLRGENYSGLEWIKGNGHDKPTEDALNTKIAELDAAEPMKLLRLERDRRIGLTDWRASSDLTISDAWKNYRQALRDLPASASPTVTEYGDLDLTSVTWPTEPS